MSQRVRERDEESEQSITNTEMNGEEITIPTKSVNTDISLQERMSDNAWERIGPARYFNRDENGNTNENWHDVFDRVASNIADAEYEFGNDEDGRNSWKQRFERAMRELRFIPNTPTIASAGTELQMLSACIAGGAPVYTKSGLKRMDSIEVGDEVLTHKGRFKPVTAHWSNGVKDTIQTTRSGSRSDAYDVGMTPDHEIYTTNGEWVRADSVETPARPELPGTVPFPDEIDLTTYTSRLSDRKQEKDIVSDGGVIKAQNYSDYSDHDYDQQLSQPTVSVSNTDGVAWLLGLFIAEGDVYGTDIRFTLGSHEDDLSSRLISVAESAFGCPVSISESSHGEWVQYRISSAFVSDLFVSLCGTGVDEKRLPRWVGNAPKSYREALLRGIIDGDGHQLSEASWKIALANPTLVYEISLLAKSLGYETSFKLDKRRELSSRDTSEVYISDAEGGRIQYRTRQSDRTEVYDMEVEDDHSFVVGEFIVHNCFVQSPDDSMEDILDTVKSWGLVEADGGGMGGAFYKLRPKGARVSTTGGTSSGPMPFIEMYDAAGGSIKQGSIRSGAQMAIMHAHHADVGRFIVSKRNEGELTNFNISVAVTDEFLDAIENDESYTFYESSSLGPGTNSEPQAVLPETAHFYDPEFEDAWNEERNVPGNGIDGKEVEENVWRDYDIDGIEEYRDRIDLTVGEPLELPARFIWSMIIDGSWRNGEPGVYHIDESNREHSFDVDEHPETYQWATNPCAEQMLSENEACNLGHVNLSLMVKENAPKYDEFAEKIGTDGRDVSDTVSAYLNRALDSSELEHTTKLGVRFLDNVVTQSDFPLEEIEEQVESKRKIGLGIMGFAQMLVQLGIPYGSDESYAVANEIMRRIDGYATEASHELAKVRGPFSDWEQSKWANPAEYPDWFRKHAHSNPSEYEDGFLVRNHSQTTIAPTGCVDESSLVSTDNGLSQLSELSDQSYEFEQWHDIDESVETEDGQRSADKLYDAGFTDVKTIRTQHGFTISGTPDHRLRTVTDNGDIVWKEMQAFESGDTIVQLRDTFSGSKEATVLDTSEKENFMHNTSDDLVLPETMGVDLAEFLGYWMGDGYTHDNVGVKVVVDASNDDIIEYITDLGERVFGVEPTVEDKGSRQILSFGGRHLPRYFKSNGWVKDNGNTGDGAASAYIPDNILSGTESELRAFIRGLFEADGCASRKVELSTVSETLATQVQTALLSLGHLFVRDSLSAEDLGDGHYGDRDRYSVRGANKREDKLFLDKMGFITKDADIELTSQSYGNDVVPTTVTGSSAYGSVSSQFGGYVQTMETYRGDAIADGGEQRPITEYVFSTVESITDDVAYTKDISVPDNNQYVANGFISHNTTSRVGNTTGGCEPIYNTVFFKNVSRDIQGEDMMVVMDDFLIRVLEENNIDVDAVEDEAVSLMKNDEFDSISDVSVVPESIDDLFTTTEDLSLKQHIRMQVEFQKRCSSGISKTGNAPFEATRDDISDALIYGLRNGVKGTTVYRQGSRETQVNTTSMTNKEFSDSEIEELKADMELLISSDPEEAASLIRELQDEIQDGGGD